MTDFGPGYGVQPYRDLGDYLPDPATGEPMAHAFVGQTATNLHEMWNAMSISNAQGNYNRAGLEEWSPNLVGITAGSGYQSSNTTGGGYLHVGQLVHVFIYVPVDSWETTTGFSVPVPAARTVVASTCGTGAVQGAGTYYPIVGRLEDQTITLYQTDPTGNDGKVGGTAPIDPSVTNTTIRFQGTYRAVEPDDGRLTLFTRTRYAI